MWHLASVRVASKTFVAFLLAATLAIAALAAPFPQSTFPTTACDTAFANPDLHYPQGMTREDGTRAFRYGSEGAAFVSGGGDMLTLTISLNFDPSVDATIKIAALDADCSGATSSGAVFSYTFRAIPSRQNTISYDGGNGLIGFNGETQRAVAIGTPRYIWVEVWDGTTTASYSYLVDML